MTQTKRDPATRIKGKGRPHFLNTHPDREALVKALVLNTATKAQLARKYGVTPDAIRLFYKRVTDEEKIEIIAEDRAKRLPANIEAVNEERKDISDQYHTLARRVEKLIDKAENRNDDAFALAAMEGLRKVLRDVATMQGKLAQQIKLDVTLNDSKEWVELKSILEQLVDEVPEAREPLLRMMRERIPAITRKGDPI